MIPRRQWLGRAQVSGDHLGIPIPQDCIGRGPGSEGLEGHTCVHAPHAHVELGADVVMAKMKGDDGAISI